MQTWLEQVFLLASHAIKNNSKILYQNNAHTDAISAKSVSSPSVLVIVPPIPLLLGLLLLVVMVVVVAVVVLIVVLDIIPPIPLLLGLLPLVVVVIAAPSVYNGLLEINPTLRMVHTGASIR